MINGKLTQSSLFRKEFRVRTFYKDIRNLPESDSTAIEKLIRVYGDFWADYSEDILKLGPFNDVATAENLDDS